jgi:hypothetical protein
MLNIRKLATPLFVPIGSHSAFPVMIRASREIVFDYSDIRERVVVDTSLDGRRSIPTPLCFGFPASFSRIGLDCVASNDRFGGPRAQAHQCRADQSPNLDPNVTTYHSANTLFTIRHRSKAARFRKRPPANTAIEHKDGPRNWQPSRVQFCPILMRCFWCHSRPVSTAAKSSSTKRSTASRRASRG